MDSQQDFDDALGEARQLISSVIVDWLDASMAGDADEIAGQVLDELVYTRPDLVYRLSEHARRIWYWPRARVVTPHTRPFVRFYPGGDEFGNTTVAVDVPRGGTIILALNIPLRRVPWNPTQDEEHHGVRSRSASIFHRDRVRDLGGRLVRAVRARAR